MTSAVPACLDLVHLVTGRAPTSRTGLPLALPTQLALPENSLYEREVRGQAVELPTRREAPAMPEDAGREKEKVAAPESALVRGRVMHAIPWPDRPLTPPLLSPGRTGSLDPASCSWDAC